MLQRVGESQQKVTNLFAQEATFCRKEKLCAGKRKTLQRDWTGPELPQYPTRLDQQSIAGRGLHAATESGLTQNISKPSLLVSKGLRHLGTGTTAPELAC